MSFAEIAMTYLIAILKGLADMPRSQRRYLAMAIDAFLCVVAVWIALSLRIGEWQILSRPVFILSLAGIVFWFPIAWRTKIYSSIIRFSGGRTMMSIALAVAGMSLPMIVTFMFFPVPGVPRTMAILHPIVFLLLLTVSRMVIRFAVVDVLHSAGGSLETRRILIYGAGRAGQQLSMALRHEPQVHLVGYVDDDRRLNGQRLNGVIVYSSDRLEWVVATLMIDEVLVALPQISRSRRREIISTLQVFPVKVRVLPSMNKIVEGEIAATDLRSVQIEDLLGRDPVAPNVALMSQNISGKCVLVSGAGGSIGSELCRQIIAHKPRRLILLEQSEYALYSIENELKTGEKSDTEIIAELGNVAEKEAIFRIYRRWTPATVFHAAAYKHVPLVELNPISGLRNNIFGTLYSCLAAEESGVTTFILVSTDKAVRPTNIMGASKRVCELILQARADLGRGPVFAMVRFGNVLGSSGSVVPRFLAQIRSGGPVTLTHKEITRFFMTIPEAAQLVIQASAMAKGGEVFVLDMGQSVKIIDLARSMIKLSGLTIRDDANPAGDIEIREIGMRPGEKLYEELLIGENPEPTAHERIIRAQEGRLEWSQLSPQLDSFLRALEDGQVAPAIAILRDLVPEYTSQGVNQEYTTLTQA